MRLKLLVERRERVTVCVDKTGHDGVPRRIDGLLARDFLLGDLDDSIPLDADIPDAIEFGFRVHHATIENNKVEILCTRMLRQQGTYDDDGSLDKCFHGVSSLAIRPLARCVVSLPG